MIEYENKIASGITVNLTAKLSVDDQTFYTCLRLIGISAREKGLEGMVLRFYDRGEPYSITPLETIEDVERVIHAAFKESED